MNSIYCSSCGAKALYEITKPKFCGACTAPFEAGLIVPSISANVIPNHQVTIAPVVRPTYPSLLNKSRPLPARARHAAPIQEQSDDDGFGRDDTHIDKDEIYARGQELAQHISASDFLCGTGEDAPKSFNYGQLVREAQGGNAVPSPKNKAPKQRRKA